MYSKQRVCWICSSLLELIVKVTVVLLTFQITIKLFHRAIKILTVCSYHATYVFQSESTLYSWLNVKELLTQNRHDI